MPDATATGATKIHAKSKDVDATSLSYQRMAKRWQPIVALEHGTAGLRDDESRVWLPQEPGEPDESYRIRRDRAVLFEGFNDTVEKLAGKPFSRPVTVKGVDSLPEPLLEAIEDMDGQGADLTMFARRLFKAAVRYGMVHSFEDMPRREEGDLPGINLPYSNLVMPQRMLGAQPGSGRVSQSRIHETQTELAGQWEEIAVNYVRVWENDGQATRWSLYREDPEKKTWSKTPVEEGTTTIKGVMPLTTLAFNPVGFMEAYPPLEGLAWMNFQHYRLSSDLQNILRFAGIALLLLKGMQEFDDDGKPKQKKFTAAANTVLNTQVEWGDGKYIEISGAAVGALATNIHDTRTQMEGLGMQPLIRTTGTQTATARAMDESRTETAIQSWIRVTERALEQIFEDKARWLGVELPADFAINIFNEFGLSLRASEELEFLLKMRMAGELTRRAFLEEVKKRSTLSDDLDLDEMIEELDEQGAALAALGVGPSPPGEPVTAEAGDDDETDEDA